MGTKFRWSTVKSFRLPHRLLAVAALREGAETIATGPIAPLHPHHAELSPLVVVDHMVVAVTTVVMVDDHTTDPEAVALHAAAHRGGDDRALGPRGDALGEVAVVPQEGGAVTAVARAAPTAPTAAGHGRSLSQRKRIPRRTRVEMLYKCIFACWNR